MPLVTALVLLWVASFAIAEVYERYRQAQEFAADLDEVHAATFALSPDLNE